VTRRQIAILGLVVLFVAGAAWAYGTGRVSISSIEHWLESLGPIAPLLFICAFVAGSMVGLPGMAFVVGGRLAFGPELGFALGYGAGVLACTVPFATARRLRRAEGAVWRPRHRLAVRAFELVETHPVRAVIALRLVLWFNPPLSYALALTRIRVGAYVAGCAIALAPVVAVAVFATGWFVS
jgi:uncharacterized membrane protein YdjX (TVP38/TMEM64 family)